MKYLSLSYVLPATVSALLVAAHFAIAAPSANQPVNQPGSIAAKGAPAQVRSTPGYFRTMLGQFEVTVLSDGTVTIPLNKLLTHTTESEVNSLLHRAAIDPANVETSINAFLIHTGTRLVLIDAGAGKVFGPNAGGRLVQSLHAAGYRPEDITDVLLTHIHADHSGGLTVGGNAVFPNATVHVDRREVEFWLNPANKAKNAPRHANAFDQAPRDLEPYIKAGRVQTFLSSGDVVPGIKAVVAPGHTPGHALYEVESDGQKLLLWGDLIHAKDAQFPSPSITIQFDVDEEAAAEQRKAAMADAASKGYLVGAAHISFPGIGRVLANGKSFLWLPLNYSEKGLVHEPVENANRN